MGRRWDLPEGYSVERDPDALTLVAPSGKVVAAFGVGVELSEVEAAAARHSDEVDAAIGNVELLLGERWRREAEEIGSAIWGGGGAS